MLTVQDAAARLGVSRRKMYQLMKQGRLPYQRVGRSRRIAVQALDRFIESQRVEPLKDLQHGGSYAYDMGCRCEACCAAWNDYHRDARARRASDLEVVADSLVHGTISTYRNYGCRCEPCVEAQAEANRRRPSRARR